MIKSKNMGKMFGDVIHVSIPSAVRDYDVVEFEGGVYFNLVWDDGDKERWTAVFSDAGEMYELGEFVEALDGMAGVVRIEEQFDEEV